MLEGAPLPSSSGSASPASAPPVTMRGTSPTTNTFTFGGEPFACSWTITMKSVVLDVAVDAKSGAVKSATLRARAVEETLPPCEATPYPPNEHVYEMTTAEASSPNVAHIELAPDAKNRPLAAAAIDVDLSKKPATASIRIHRTDQTAPLDWTVLAKLNLESQ